MGRRGFAWISNERAGVGALLQMLYLQNLLNPSPTGQDDYVADSQTLTEVWMSTVEIQLFLRSERKRCMQWTLKLEFSLIFRDTLDVQDEALS